MPQTLWDDGDALDVVLLTTYPLAPGILVEARPVGIMTMIDGGDSDDKMIAVPASDPRFDAVLTLKDVNPYTLKEMRHFFETYKTIDNKVVEVKGFHEKEQAHEAIMRSRSLYNEKFPQQ